MGGKTSTSTQQVAVPSQVLAQYQSVNSLANQTASTPFQQYGGEFVAPINQQQQTGISQTNQYAQEAQPYYGAATSTLGSTQSATNPINAAATGLIAASAEQVNASPLTGSQIDSYLSPYLNTVLGSTEQLQNQSNQQQQAGQLGDAINSGAFGGDRTGIAAANLEQQQNLENSNVIAGIANTGYTNAQSVAQQQQGVNLGASQANRAALSAAGSQLAGIGQTAYGEGANTAAQYGALGTGAEDAALTGASAVTGAGTLQQQTSQAQDTALYNQFLQQQSYPFQVDQFLANIAEGTGALSGSTTTTSQPGGFFSDKRLKHDIKRVGKTFDGQVIYSYKMHGDDRTHMGLIAQDVEKKHPHAVGLAAGYKTVDYGRATEDAANRGHFYSGGVVPLRRAYAGGGAPTMADIAAQQALMYQRMMQQNQNRAMPTGGGGGYQLATAQGSPPPQQSGSSQVNNMAGLINNGYKTYKAFNKPTPNGGQGGVAGNGSALNDPSYFNPSTVQPSGMGATDFSNLGDVSPSTIAPATTGQPIADAAVGASDAGVAGGADTLVAGGADAAGTGLAAGAGAGAAGAAGAAAGSAAAGTVAAAPALVAGAGMTAADLGLAAGVADAAALAAKRGGRIGMDAGGVPYTGVAAGQPYSSPTGTMDIPDQTNTNKLQPAGQLHKTPTGFQNLLQMGNVNDLSSNIGSVFSNQGVGGSARGGVVGRRIHKDDGGALDDDTAINGDGSPLQPGDTYKEPDKWTAMKDAAMSFMSPDAYALSSGQLKYSPPTPSNAKQEAMDASLGTDAYANTPAGGGAMDLAGLGRGISNAAGDFTGTVKANFSPQTAQAATTAPSTAPAPAPTNRGVAGGARAALPTQGPDVPTQAPSSPVTYAGGVSPSSMAPSDADAQAPSSVPIQSGASAFGDKVSKLISQAGGSMSKPENWIPVVKALAAMGTAPTKHLGVALAAGAGAGAGSYLDTRQQQADIAQTQAHTGLIGQNQWNSIQANAPPNTQAVHGTPPAGSNVQQLHMQDGSPYYYSPNYKSTDLSNNQQGSQLPTKWSQLGKQGQQYSQNDVQRMQIMNPDQLHGEQAMSTNAEKTVSDNGARAQAMDANLSQLSQEVMKMPEGGAVNPGIFSDFRTKIVSGANDLMRSMGYTGPQLGVQDLATKAGMEKLAAMQQFAAASGADQNSLGALTAAGHVVPNSTMSKDQMIEVLGGMYVDKQRGLDEQNYMREYKMNASKQNPMGAYYNAENARQAFRVDHNDVQYAQEKQALLSSMRTKSATGNTQLQDVYDGAKPKMLDKKYNIDGLGRYVTGR